jgi:hypothetical protein
MTFAPETVTLHEAGPDAPYKWTMTDPLVWTGTFRGQRDRRISVPTSPWPFTTDLASVPRCLTWLFPRYGKYTKAAVVHDFLCKDFAKPPDPPDLQSPLPLNDRSDADEVFLLLMTELAVPKVRRRLMWAAVSWATVFTGLVPGRASRPPAVRWITRIVAGAAILGAVAFVIARHDWIAVVTSALLLPAVLLVVGAVALGRLDRAGDYLLIYVITVLFAGLLLSGVAVGLALAVYLIVEKLIDLVFDRQPKPQKLSKRDKVFTPQFARLVAVMQS